MVEKLIRCRLCNQVIPLYREFMDFGENNHLPGVTWAEEDLHKREEFLRIHTEHALEELIVDLETCISDKPIFELIKDSYFEATNGQEKFLIRRSRERFDRPAYYEIIPGRLKISTVSYKLLEEELRKELRNSNESEPLEDDIINGLLKAFQEELQNISSEELFQEIEVREGGVSPLLLYGAFKEKHWANIFQRLQNFLPQGKVACLADFLEKNKRIKDLAPLMIQREISILNP